MRVWCVVGHGGVYGADYADVEGISPSATPTLDQDEGNSCIHRRFLRRSTFSTASHVRFLRRSMCESVAVFEAHVSPNQTRIKMY